jgi:putative CocE/NonD family hydrolase
MPVGAGAFSPRIERGAEAHSQVDGDVQVDRGVAVRMRDGVELATDVYRPAGGNTAIWPVVLERTSYDRARPDLVESATLFARRGYAFVLQDCRGRFDSGGEFSLFFNPHHEGLDGFDIVEWIAAQSWCNGDVATTGFSFSGASAQALALERPANLRTQIIIDAGYNYWRRSGRHEGAFLDATFATFAIWLASTGHEAARNPEVKARLDQALANLDDLRDELPLRPGESPLAGAPSYERWYWGMASRADFDEFWLNPAAALEAHVDRYPDIPLCVITSWYGVHTWASFAKFLAFRKQNAAATHLICGPWVHTFDYGAQSSCGEVDFGSDAIVALDEIRLAWFDRWLKGLPTEVDKWPAVRYFVMGGSDGRRGRSGTLYHGGHWASATTWHPQHVTEAALHLWGDGSLRTDPPGPEAGDTRFRFDPGDPVPTIGGTAQTPIDGAFGLYAGPYDQRSRAPFIRSGREGALADRSDVLVFRTEPLREAVEVAGQVTVRLFVSSMAVDTDFTVKLVDEYPQTEALPDGFAMNLCDTIVRLRYRDGRTLAEPARAGEVHRVELGPMPIANRFDIGHRIRLDVSSSSFPQFDVNPNTGALPCDGGPAVATENTVYHSAEFPSQLQLPIGTASTREQRQ